MIRSISINNYKLFKDFKLNFEDGENIICGSNGSCKTALLDVIYAIKEFILDTNNIIDNTFPLNVFTKFKTKTSDFEDITINMEIGEEDELFVYNLIIRNNFEEHDSRVFKETLTYIRKEECIKLMSLSGESGVVLTDKYERLTFKCNTYMSGHISDALNKSNNSKIRTFIEMIYKIIPVKIVPPLIRSIFLSGNRFLEKFGENFAEWRYTLGTDIKTQELILEECKYFIPGIISIENLRVIDRFKLIIVVKYNDEIYKISFDELSEGQKVLLVLYTLLMNAPENSTIILDNPENFISPTEIQPLLNKIHDIWEEKNVQFIIISNNPITLNWYNKNAIIFSIESEPPRIAYSIHNGDESDETILNDMQNYEGWNKLERVELMNSLKSEDGSR